MDLLEALEALETENDEHWTAQGLPKMELLKEWTGLEDITRSMVDEAAPDYTRTNRFELFEDDDEQDPPGVPVNVDSPSPDPDATPDPADEQPKPGPTDEEMMEPILQARRECEELRIQRGQIDREIIAKEHQLQALETVYQANRPRLNHSQVVQQYQQRQIAVRKEARENQKRAAEAMGLDQMPVSRVGMSKLDRTMAGRRRASRNRPNVPSQVRG